jgi:hypothetical protein
MHRPTRRKSGWSGTAGDLGWSIQATGEPMRRKRLKHNAHILCDMFHGWRLMNCWDRILALGSGILEIDALSAECTFNGQPIESLTIAEELRLWLRDDLAAQGIPLTAIRSARLEVQLELPDTWPHCSQIIESRSKIETDDNVYAWPPATNP